MHGHLRLFLALAILPASLAQVDDPWIPEARGFLAEHPSDVGLASLIEALERLDVDAVGPHSEALRSIAAIGWSTDHVEIVTLIQSQAPALQAAAMAATSASMEFPSPRSFRSPIPDSQRFRLLLSLMVADARQCQAAGDPGAAVEGALRTLRLSNHLCAEDTTLIQHLIGIAGMRMACLALESALIDPALRDDELRGAESEIQWVREHHRGVTPTLRVERLLIQEAVEQMRGDPALQQMALPDHEVQNLSLWERAMVQHWIANPASFEQAARPVWEDILTNAERPPWEREMMGADWLAPRVDGPVPGMHFPNFDRIFTADDEVVAHLALCQALCALRVGDHEALTRCTDPFTGQTVSVSNESVRSFGPDRVDDIGVIVYDVTNGILSTGDIVAPR